MNDRQRAAEIFAEFKALPESKHIASEFALYHLSKFLTEHKVKSVLEVGAGIGTITRLLLVHPNRPERIVSTEHHPVCLAALETNLAKVDKTGWTLVTSVSDVDISEKYDLVIFDGKFETDALYGLFKDGTWCYVEGNRSVTRDILTEKLRAGGLDLKFESFFPGGYKFRYKSKRRLLGMPLPKFQFKKRKGCHIGSISAIR